MSKNTTLEAPVAEKRSSEISPPSQSGSPSDLTAGPTIEPELPVFKPSKGFILAFISICIITLAAALDTTSLSIALPIFTVKLKGTAIEAFWSGASFLVTSTVSQPVIARMNHVFGRKEVK
jgi:hypothetical protein